MGHKSTVLANAQVCENSDESETENDAPSHQEAGQSKEGTLTRRRDSEKEKEPSRKRKNSAPPPEEAKNQKTKVQLVIEKTDKAEQELVYGEFGHYRVKDGQVLNKRYKIIRRIGSGAYSSVWMANDKLTQKIVAVKVGRCGDAYHTSSRHEIFFLNMTERSSNIVTLLDNFTVKSRYGEHIVMVSEMMGPDLFDIVAKSNQSKLTVDRIRKFCRDILQGLDQLHRQAKIVHLDLKPENIMITAGAGETEQESYDIDLSDPSCTASLKIGDLGLASLIARPFTREVQNCHFRAPEAFLKAQVGVPADIWSFGCIAYEMATRNVLFPKTPSSNERFDSPYFAQIAEVVGPIKKSYYKKTEENKERFEHLFQTKDVIRSDARKNWLSAEEIQKWSTMGKEDASEFSDFLYEILQLDPKKRPTAKKALNLPFLKNKI